MYLQILLRLNLIIVFLLLIRKIVGNKLRKKFVYGLWILVPVFLLSFPFVRVPQLFHWEMNIGKIFQLKEKEVSSQGVKENTDFLVGSDIIEAKEKTDEEFVTPIAAKEMPEPMQKNSLNQNEVLSSDELLIQNEIPNQNETWIEKADAVNTQTQSVTSTSTPQKGMKLSTVLGVGYLGIVGILLLCMILSNVLFHNSCKKKRIYLRKSEDAGLAVYHLEGIASPFLMGKTIYLPTYMVEDEQIRYAILHEESHYRHGDAIWVIVRYIVLAVYFYDPIIWLAFFASGHDCELACDEEVLGKIGEEESSAYGACLLGSLEQKFQKPPRMVMTTNMSTGKKFMKERIVNIANKKKKSRITMAIAAVIMVTVVGCSFEKQNVDTSKQESLTSKIEETTEESVVELAEETDTEEAVSVTESDEVADNTIESNDTGESNNASKDENAIDETKKSSTLQPCTYKEEDVAFLEYESFCNFKYNEKPDTENYKDFKYDLDLDGELDTITLKNQQYGSDDFSLYLNGKEFYQFPEGGVGVYIAYLDWKDHSMEVAACYEDPSGDGLKYMFFSKQGEEMIYSGEMKRLYFTQPNTDLYTLEDVTIECELDFDGTSYENPDYVKDFKYDLDGDGEIDTITIKRSEEPQAVAGDGADLKIIKLYLNGEEFYEFVYGGAAVYIVDVNKEDDSLEVVAYDDGPSDDPEYTFFRKQGEEMIYATYLWGGYEDTFKFDQKGRIYEEPSMVQMNPTFYETCCEFKEDTVEVYIADLKTVENVWFTRRGGSGVYYHVGEDGDYYLLDYLNKNPEFKVLEFAGPYGQPDGLKLQLKDGEVCYASSYE